MSLATTDFVLVTGASGYLGSYITYQLLEDGYKVRGAARGRKLPLLKEAFSKYSNFEAVEISDISTGDFSEILKDVHAIIHPATPIISGHADPEAALKGAIGGSVHVLEEAKKAKVAKIITTSSMASYPMPDGPYGADDWNSVTIEDAIKSDDPSVIYFAQKKYADLAVLEFADKNPEIDVTIITPCYIFGPLAPGFEHLVPEPHFRSFSTAFYMYSFINGEKAIYPFTAGYCDVRDVARAHILALRSPPASVVGRKRLALAAPYPNGFREALNCLAEGRPELKARLADPDKTPVFPALQSDKIDYKRLEEVLGLKKDSFKTWKETVLDGVDRVYAVEEFWKGKGFEVVPPTGMPH